MGEGILNFKYDHRTPDLVNKNLVNICSDKASCRSMPLLIQPDRVASMHMKLVVTNDGNGVEFYSKNYAYEAAGEEGCREKVSMTS